MRDYPYWGGMTDTRELPACQIGAPIHEVPTSMILFTDTRPAPTVPARPRRRLRAAARTAYTALITLGVMTLTGCAAVGPDGLADALAQALG
jgi:hypothetical protein